MSFVNYVSQINGKSIVSKGQQYLTDLLERYKQYSQQFVQERMMNAKNAGLTGSVVMSMESELVKESMLDILQIREIQQQARRNAKQNLQYGMQMQNGIPIGKLNAVISTTTPYDTTFSIVPYIHTNAQIPPGSILKIDTEIFITTEWPIISGREWTFCNVKRGQMGTTCATHTMEVVLLESPLLSSEPIHFKSNNPTTSIKIQGNYKPRALYALSEIYDVERWVRYNCNG